MKIDKIIFTTLFIAVTVFAIHIFIKTQRLEARAAHRACATPTLDQCEGWVKSGIALAIINTRSKIHPACFRDEGGI